MLEDLSYELSLLQAAEITGEPFHSDYKKNRSNFRRLIKAFNMIADDLEQYFKELAQRVPEKINWTYYYEKVMKAATVTESFNWEDEIVYLQVAIQDGLEEAFDVGVDDAQKDLLTDYGYTASEPYAQVALKNYSLFLAEELNKTTQKRVKNSILRSINLHETREQAVQRLIPIVDNPKRAVTIAQTELVNAYSQAKLATAEEVGAELKIWQDGQSGACPICAELNEKEVGLDQEFGDGIMNAPAHPNCKCRISIKFKSIEGAAKKKPKLARNATGEKGFWVTTKGGKKLFIKEADYKPKDKNKAISPKKKAALKGVFKEIEEHGNYLQYAKIHSNLKLSPSETDALNSYKTNANYNINKIHRNSEFSKTLKKEDINAWMVANVKSETIERTIAKSKLEDNLVVYRGGKTGQKLDVGTKYRDEGFISTSTRKDAANRFRTMYGKEDETPLLKIYVKKGHPAILIDSIAKVSNTESEVLLQRKTTFTVINKSQELMRLPGIGKFKLTDVIELEADYE